MRLRRPPALSATSSSPYASACAPGDRHPAQRLGEQAADGLDVVAVGQLDVEQLGEVLDRQPGRDTRAVSSSMRSTGARSTSYSSVISPTISSRMSSMVTRPAVPPYSSMTIAMWVRVACISRSSSSTGLDSGT